MTALPSVHAADFSASLLTGGNWSDPAIWSTNPTVPNNGADTFDVEFGIGSTLNLDTPVTIEAFNWTGSGTLTGTQSLTLNGALTWSGGALQTTLNAASGGTLSGVQYNYGTLNTGGTMTWAGNFGMYGYDSAAINNGGTWDNTGDSVLILASGAPVFNNTGTFMKSGGTGTTSIGWQFNNSGTVNVNSGTLGLSNGGTSTGDFAVILGSRLEFNGTHDLSGNTSGAGTLAMSIH